MFENKDLKILIFYIKTRDEKYKYIYIAKDKAYSLLSILMYRVLKNLVKFW